MVDGKGGGVGVKGVLKVSVGFKRGEGAEEVAKLCNPQSRK